MRYNQGYNYYSHTQQFSPVLTGSITPTSRLRENRERIGRRSTARKDPISTVNHQWRIKNPPTNGSFLYRNNPTFTMAVEGQGQITVKPDQAKLTLGVVTENLNVQLAQQENANISNQVIDALKQMGIEETSIRTTIYSVYPRYDYIEGKSILRGYEVEHLLEVIVKDLSNVGVVYDVAIKNGANRSGGIQFLVANPDVHYREALKRAIHNAREKAEDIAQTIGTTLTKVPIKIIEQGEQQERVYPAFSTQVAAATTTETPPIQTGDFTIDARVKVVYAYSG
ncbi:SIMPL domain-containing protein [Bacillus sp. V3B]|uniref:SIMPL domain-containing protein n=1 Tax=Bacillus sp. V3B TaxID=2804915 RepID=UPI00210D8C9E|nr:SIMPL domain-containing protein [Bacillus sp. V3B]MCQ6276989.1 SIMPL domain-containing protein [Bacillus sp. V3B]